MTLATLTILFTLATQKFNLPDNVLASLCWVESKYDIHAIHHDDGNSDSLGVCQIKYETAQWLGFKGTKKDLMKPENNIYYAGKYLAKQLKRYNGDLRKAVIAYNQGHAGQLTSTKYSVKVFKQMEVIEDELYER